MTFLIIQWAVLYCICCWWNYILKAGRWDLFFDEESYNSITHIADVICQTNDIMQVLPFIEDDVLRVNFSAITESPSVGINKTTAKTIYTLEDVFKS